MKNVNIFILFAILFINLTPDIKNSIKQIPPKKLREYILWIIDTENKLKNFNEITVENIELIKESILSQKSKENTEEDKTIECFLNKIIKKKNIASLKNL